MVAFKMGRKQARVLLAGVGQSRRLLDGTAVYVDSIHRDGPWAVLRYAQRAVLAMPVWTLSSPTLLQLLTAAIGTLPPVCVRQGPEA